METIRHRSKRQRGKSKRLAEPRPASFVRFSGDAVVPTAADESLRAAGTGRTAANVLPIPSRLLATHRSDAPHLTARRICGRRAARRASGNRCPPIPSKAMAPAHHDLVHALERRDARLVDL